MGKIGAGMISHGCIFCFLGLDVDTYNALTISAYVVFMAGLLYVFVFKALESTYAEAAQRAKYKRH